MLHRLGRGKERIEVTSKKMLAVVLGSVLGLGAFSAYGISAQTAVEAGTLRATLPNGMRVVIIRNSLAPVVTVETNFIVGGDETPEGFPGMAHAEEHMAFRGCTGMTADQTAAIYAEMGGENNVFRDGALGRCRCRADGGGGVHEGRG
jgi:hypothetical protein